jgi:hypothetical protein
MSCADWLALGLADRFEDAALGDAAKIVVDRRPPAGFHHVEIDGARQTIGLLDTPAARRAADTPLPP